MNGCSSMNLEHLKRRLALAYYRATGGFPAKLAGGRYRLVPEDRKFWRMAAGGQWERHTFRILEQLLRPDSVYVDVGAWIGPTVLFAAARCKVVYCIEPDAVAYERLLGNLRMNGIDNVLPFHGALGVRNGTVQIAGEKGKGFGTSETRVQATPTDGGADVAATVLAMDLPRFIQHWGIERIDLMKIDIEGAEFDLAPALISICPPPLNPPSTCPCTRLCSRNPNAKPNSPPSCRWPSATHFAMTTAGIKSNPGIFWRSRSSAASGKWCWWMRRWGRGQSPRRKLFLQSCRVMAH